jgi:Protein of unknown function (DUF2934)
VKTKTIKLPTAMSEEHPSWSAVGVILDEETEIAALAQSYYEEEGRPKDRSLEHWSRAEREVRARHAHPVPGAGGSPLTGSDIRTEELMHLDT